jgi:hypothetical protein
MKNLLLISLAFCFNFNLFSQVTIDLDNLPGIGLDVSIGIDSFELKNYGNADLTNMQTWNYDHLYPYMEDTIYYKDKLQTPYTQLHNSSADFALSLGDGFMNGLLNDAYIFFEIDSTGMHGVAMAANYEGQNVALLATDPEVYIPIPMQIGVNVYDTGRYEAVLGDTTVIHYTFKSFVVDAFGPLSLAQGTFPVIRLVEKHIIVDSMYVVYNGFPLGLKLSESTLKRISYITNDSLYKHPLVTLTMADTSDTAAIKYATWIWDGTYPQNSIVEKSINIIKNAYPNPVKDELMLEISSKESTDIDVLFLDINGRIVKRSATSVNSGSNLLSMQLSGFASGTYFMALKSEGKLLGSWPFEKL